MIGLHYPGETEILDDKLRASAPGCFVTLSDGITHYELSGPETGQVVVLIHGFSIPLQIWDTVFHPLVEAGFRVLRYDLYGRGFSDRPLKSYNQDLFDQQLLHLLKALGVKNPVDLIGLSMGGAISVLFCDRHPELARKLILIDPAGFPGDMPGWAKWISAPLLGEFVMSFFSEKSLLSSIAGEIYSLEQYPNYLQIAIQQMKIKGYRRALLSTLRHDLFSDLSEIYQRVGKQNRSSCLIWGVEDKIIPFGIHKQVRQAIPDMIFYPIEAAGHVPHYERPHAVIPILIDFLNGSGDCTSVREV
jgi:pimeloyl-ACP methyl ester carboxylesterase